MIQGPKDRITNNDKNSKKTEKQTMTKIVKRQKEK